MSRHNVDYLAEQLASGGCTMGQLRIEPGFKITHSDDAGREDLKTFRDPHDAIAIARYDDNGLYRPLKTAPNLVHGWRLDLATLDAVLLALDFIYPASVGTAAWQMAGDLRPVSLRQTLARQSGMYAVTRKLGDAQARELIRNFCHKGCIRQTLWPLDSGQPSCQSVEKRGEIPLLCAEACNLFVSEARKVVKASAPAV